MVEQTTPTQVTVSWTAPPAPPNRYQVQITVNSQPNRTEDTTATTFNIPVGNDQYGVYSIQVTSDSAHLPGGTAGPMEITVEGEGYLLL